MEKRLKMALICLLLIAVSTGCSVSTRVALNPGTKRSPISHIDVRLYNGVDRAPAKYLAIAHLTSKGDYRYTDLPEMYDSMRKAAAKIGANGIILGDFNEPENHDKVLNHFYPVATDRKGNATAIYVIPTEQKE